MNGKYKERQKFRNIHTGEKRTVREVELQSVSKYKSIPIVIFDDGSRHDREDMKNWEAVNA